MEPDSEQIYLRNPALELIPLGEQLLQLRLPHFGQTLEASRYQVQLLQAFNEGATPQRVLERFPFGRKENQAFLNACIRCGVLLRRRDDDTLRYPERVQPARGLLGAPAFDPDRPAAFAFLGAPWDAATSGRPGARFGPAMLREASTPLQYQVDPVEFEPQGFYDFGAGRALLQKVRLADAGDVFAQPGEAPEVFYDRLSRAVLRLLRAGSVPLVLGGDHSISFAVLRAFVGQRIAVLHLDAHSDLDEPHPREVLHHGSVMSAVHEQLQQVSRIVQVGLRGVYGLSAAARPERVTQIGMDELRRDGVAAVLDRLPENLLYYLSVDVDVLDPAYLSCTGTPVPGGMAPHELKDLLRQVGEQREVVGADLVELAALGDGSDNAASLGVELLLTLADAVVEGERRRAAKR